MANFDKAVPTILNHEGGYVFDKDDPGGETNYGISKRSYPNEDIKNLTLDRAKQIYREDYWNANGYSGFEDQAVATKVFDLAVNMGPQQAHRLLQRALRATGVLVKEDGIIGPNTLGAVNRAIPGCLLAALRSEAAGFYRVLVAKNPTQERFIRGWLDRAYSA